MLSLREWRIKEGFPQAGVSAPEAPVTGTNPQEEAEVQAAQPEIEEILHNAQLASLLQRVFAKFKNISIPRKKQLLGLVIEKLMNPEKGRGLSSANIKQTVRTSIA